MMDDKLNIEWQKQMERFKKNEPIEWEKLKKIERSTVHCLHCRTPMPDGIFYDSVVECPTCGGEFDLHE